MNDLKRKELAFFGKITAGMTHEIKNILAIIQESTGLMEDIFAVIPDEAFPHKDKFHTSLKRIFGQIDRGVDISTRLNSFAHSADHCPASLDLNEITEQMVLLTSRFARLKHVVLETNPSDPPLNIKSDPVAVEMALFESIEILLNVIGPGRKIMVSPRKIENQYVLGVGCEDTVLPKEESLAQITSTERWGSLQATMTHLGGTAKAFGLAPEILLYLPESIDD